MNWKKQYPMKLSLLTAMIVTGFMCRWSDVWLNMKEWRKYWPEIVDPIIFRTNSASCDYQHHIVKCTWKLSTIECSKLLCVTSSTYHKLEFRSLIVITVDSKLSWPWPHNDETNHPTPICSNICTRYNFKRSSKSFLHENGLICDDSILHSILMLYSVIWWKYRWLESV